MKSSKVKFLLFCALVFLMGAGQVLGDWDQGDDYKMHWPQTPKPGGFDVDFHYTQALGDDWRCTETGPVTDIHFWASWVYNEVGTIDGFTVTIYDDDPCGTGGYSQPNTPLWTRDFSAGDFTVRTMPPDLQGWFEPDISWYDPCNHDQWCQVNITHIDDPFIQKAGEIYWLVISDVNTPPGTQLGWKETDKNFNDDGVWGGPVGGGWEPLEDPDGTTMDLAFVITTGPLKHRNLKWSQPPIEIDPNLVDPIYCGWDEKSFLWDYSGSTLVYENWDAYGGGDYYMPGAGLPVADDINLAGTERKLDHYDFSVISFDGTAPYTVTSELYTEVIDPCTGWTIPGAPIAGTFCNHNVAVDGYVVLDCATGSGAILPDNLWLVLTFDTNDAGWYIGETAETGFTNDWFAWDDGMGWALYWFGGPPYSGFEANIWCESDVDLGPIVADDFRCLGSMPITSIHWWGSYIGWESPDPPPGALLPIGWRIGFWSNVPAGSPPDPDYSYPEVLLWAIDVPADRVDEEWVGIDQFPGIPPETCFQYYLQLDPNEYFWQDDYNDSTQDSIFWISIAAIFPSGADPQYPWGWKTRPWSWMDDAVRIWLTDDPVPGTVLGPSAVEPIEDPIWGESYDVAFELDTDPNYIKHEQPFTGIRDWPHYWDELSMGTVDLEQATKWVQYPDLSPSGVDVDATVDLAPDAIWSPQILADDFNCTVTEPITDIHIWASWYHDQMPFQDAGAVDFTLSIYSDKPAVDAGSWSEPNELLWSQDFAAGDFLVWTWASGLREGYYVPCEVPPFYEAGADDTCYQYDFYIDPCNAFVQKGDPCNPVVYWLMVEAHPLFDPALMEPARFGWKTSTDHWNDDAVWTDDFGDSWNELRYPVGHPFAGQSIDLAFEITTEEKVFRLDRLVADDWPCDQNTPITAAVWWGSYIGYQYQPCTTPWPRPTKPDYFLLNIWTDVPADSTDPMSYSHPNDIIWEYKAYDYDEVLVGYDKYPHDACGVPIPGPREPVFRYSVRLPEEAWFDQNEPNDVYWFSVVAVYDENEPGYSWGWTNHKHVYNDDAVEGYFDPPAGWFWYELYDQTGMSEDMSFILFTDPGCLCKGDVSDTGGFGAPDTTVNIGDLNYTLMAMFAVYPTGDPTGIYAISPVPPNLDCMNVSDTSGFGAPDTVVDIGDLNYTLMAMFTAYPTGDPTGIYDLGGCLP